MTIPAGLPLLDFGDASRCSVLEFAVARDLDECAQNSCGEGAICVNSLASFTCTCPKGWTGSPFVICNPPKLDAPPLRLRVEVESNLSLGWRVAEVSVYSDPECTVSQVATDSLGPFALKAFDDRYCFG